MNWFVVHFYSIYLAVHLYVFLKIKSALTLNRRQGLIVIACMSYFIAAPFITRQFESAGMGPAARIFALTGYLWLGLIFSFFVYAVTLDLLRLTLLLGGWISSRNVSMLLPSPRQLFFIPLYAALLASVYGYFEARDIKVETVRITTSKLPPGMRSLRIAQISDVHLGQIIRDDMLAKITSIIKDSGPDIVVSTGDLMDSLVCNLAGFEDAFLGITPPLGKYAVLGNHEFYAGLDNSVRFIKSAGFNLLRDETLSIGNGISLAGVDDTTIRRQGLSKSISERKVVSLIQGGAFRLLLKHRPDVDPDADGTFDLQLSGHTHKGQIFPFTLMARLYYPVHAGLARLAGGAWLYVSRGTGTWGPPIRFLSPPEVTLIELSDG